IVVAGGFVQPVGKILGAVLLRLLDPAEVVLVQQQPDLRQLWDTARFSVQAKVPIAESASRRQMTVVTLTADAVSSLSWWRHWVVNLWVLAVQSQVPLPALNLILVLPLIAFFLVIIRHVIGLETFGTFAPMLLALAFLTTGLGWGFVVFAII